MLLIYFKTNKNPIFDVHNLIGIELLNRAILNFSHMNEHKFSQNFGMSINYAFLCNVKTASHYVTMSL